MNTLIGLAIVLAASFFGGIALEFHNGLKEDRKYNTKA